MLILAYTYVVLCVLLVGVFCAVQCYLLLTDAIIYRKDKLTAAMSGTVMGLAVAACVAVFLWLLNHSPL